MLKTKIFVQLSVSDLQFVMNEFLKKYANDRLFRVVDLDVSIGQDGQFIGSILYEERVEEECQNIAF